MVTVQGWGKDVLTWERVGMGWGWQTYRHRDRKGWGFQIKEKRHKNRNHTNLRLHRLAPWSQSIRLKSIVWISVFFLSFFLFFVFLFFAGSSSFKSRIRSYPWADVIVTKRQEKCVNNIRGQLHKLLRLTT